MSEKKLEKKLAKNRIRHCRSMVANSQQMDGHKIFNLARFDRFWLRSCNAQLTVSRRGF